VKNETTKLLLDSGDPDEYKTIADLVRQHDAELWGSTTNPTLIAKKLTGRKIKDHQEAFALQKNIVLEILQIVPGAVSAEVYADEKTTVDQMTSQGREIATWHERVVVKLPTTHEGFKARTILRKEHIQTNNTLVFSQQQIFAICLHEKIMQKQFGPMNEAFPPFISPFIGRLEDSGENGMQLVEHGMKIKNMFTSQTWMLEASVRRNEHIRQGFALGSELITAPAKTYQEWFALSTNEQQALNESTVKSLKPIAYWDPPKDLLEIATLDEFMQAISSHRLDIRHDLTNKGLIRFADDWNALITS